MKTGYNEDKCQSALKDLYRCCADMYDRLEKEGKAPEEKSPSCPLPNVVERKLRQLDA